jgi:N-acyl-D-amino-acid deacylase
MFDYLLENVRVYDGTGLPGYSASVAISGDKISTVSRTSLRGEARVNIDGGGLVLCPGFVDMHTHADVSVFTNPYAKSLVHQGVTLAVLGNCGNSSAPLSDEESIRMQKRLSEWDLDVKWSSFGEYMDAVDNASYSINVATQIGHNTVRRLVMEPSTKLVPSSAEMEQMKALVEMAMKAGAVGISTGLMYTPGFYSETRELIELCKRVSSYGGIHSTHMRGEANELLKSMAETIKIAEEAEISTQISHHRAECRVNWGLIRHTLQLMHNANREQANITCDFFPYLACGVGGGIPMPRWANPLYLSKEEVARILDVPELRDKVKEQMRMGTSLGPEARAYEPVDSMEDVIITIYPGRPDLQGKNIVELAEIHGIDDPVEFYLSTVLSEKSYGVLAFDVWEEDLNCLVQSPLAMIGTDSGFVDNFNQPNRHPRAYGSFPKMLGRYVRDLKMLSLEEAVLKLSTIPHAKLGMSDRGLVREEHYADLVIFNLKTVNDKADYSGIASYPTGIEYVFVNGKPVIFEGRHTEALPGRLLKGTGAR